MIHVGKKANEGRVTNQGENIFLKLVEKYVGSGQTDADNFLSCLNLATVLMIKPLEYVGTYQLHIERDALSEM